MRKLLLLTTCFIGLLAMAQPVNLDLFKKLKPRSIGPAGMSGRVTSIDALWSNPDVIYVGTASGGVWKTENAGANWTAVFDEQPILNIGAVTITQSNPSVLWVGTGEGNPRNSINLGAGIYKSLDAGKTWKLMGLEKTRNIHRVIVDPTNPNIVYAAAIGNPYGIHPERGVFKTTDGGETWTKILYANDTTGCAELVMDPQNPNKLIANMWQHRRTPYSFSSGGKGSGIYMTVDAGKTWKKLGKEQGLPDGDIGRAGITICHDMPNVAYMLLESEKNALYRTDDGGNKWEKVNSDKSVVQNRPFYFQDIRCDPKNENRLYNVYQMISMSEDGGKNFKVIIPYEGIHPDHHAFWIHPQDPSLIIDGNDGGIGISRDRGRHWNFSELLPVGQFYHVNVDDQIPYRVMGGLQDNGSWVGPAYTFTNGGIRNYYWETVWGGDGFDVAPDPEDKDWFYAMSQGGNLGRRNIVTGEAESIQPPDPNLETHLRYNWNAGFAQDPFDKKTIYYGSSMVHKSTDKGASWQTISGDLSTNNKKQQDQSSNGGLSIDITGAENYNTILCIEPSKLQKDVLWVGTDDGNVQLTKDGGKTWTNFRGKIAGMPQNGWVPQIRAGRHNAGEAFVVCNNYRNGDFGVYVFRTKDFGTTWTQMVDDKKATGYALCVLQDPVEPNLVFVGTEQGLWVSFDNGQSFKQYKNGYPSVSTYDMVIQEREADLVIATFGRAIYVLDDIRPLRKIAAANGADFAKRLTVFEPPVNVQASNKAAPGYEWSTWGLYDGENRNTDVMLSFYVKPAGAADTGKNKIKLDSATIKIFDNSGMALRTYKTKLDSGFNRIFYDYSTKGARRPGSRKPKKGDPEQGGGMLLAPGQYKVLIEVDKQKDSTMVTIKEDPRSPFNKAMYAAKKQKMEELLKHSDRLTAAMDQLNDAEDIVKKIEAQLKDAEGKEVDSLRKSSKAMTDSIKNIRNFINGKEQEKQGYGTVYQLTVREKLGDARTAIMFNQQMPNQQTEGQIQQAAAMVQQAVDKINNFTSGKWKDYQKQYETYTVPKLFGEFKPID
jgi:photosystem II stability/assembly factor-like uncharacterized protein